MNQLRFKRLVGSVTGKVCGITAADQGVCFVADSGGRRLDWASDEPVRDISATLHGACWLSLDGAARCSDLNIDFPADAVYAHISSAPFNVCTQTAAGLVDCSFIPDAIGGTPVPDGLLFKTVAAGFYNSCGITLDDALVCFTSKEDYRIMAPNLGKIRAVDVMYDWACATNQRGQFQCWGFDNLGGMGTPPVFPNAPYASFGGACALTVGGDVVCPGTDRPLPQGPFIEIATPCALRADGSVACWQ